MATVILLMTKIKIQVFWNAGCQLVALNFQTLGKVEMS